MPHPDVNYLIEGQTAIIEMDRAPVNAIDLDFITAIIEAFRQAGADEDVRAVVLASAVPNTFCGGLDLTVMRTLTGEGFREILEKLYMELYDVQYTLGKPTIAAISGAARAGGMTLAVSCDIILAEKGVTLGYPEVKVGIIPGIHFVHLPRQIGRHRAFELLFSGEPIVADDAEKLGLINRAVYPGQARALAMSMARRMSSISPVVMRRGRDAFMRANDRDYRRDIGAVVDAMCALVETEDAQEGMAAFAEKRRPKW